MTTVPTETKNAGPMRREVMIGGASLALVAAGSAVVGQAPVASKSAPDIFLAVSRLVTGSRIDDPAATDRAWAQLVALDAAFPAAVQRLHAAIAAAGIRDMAALLASPLGEDVALIATARAITSAWYLGYTGKPVSLRAKDTTGFVTFTGALMYRPTIDATVIPTYARGRTDFWVDPPAGTPVPAGPSGDPAWPSVSTIKEA